MKYPSLLFRVLILIFITSLAGCGVQSIPRQSNEVDAAWSEVLNQYQRRLDLIPNIVETVKGYAKHEKETLQAVVEARAQATNVKVDAKDLTPEKLEQFQRSQAQLGGALSRLLVVAEQYPDLKANANFRDLTVNLEGTENRIAIARQRYIETVKEFNNLVSVFPTNLTNSLFFHYDKKPQFKVEDEAAAKTAPKVKF
jgi:LemA protein